MVTWSDVLLWRAAHIETVQDDASAARKAVQWRDNDASRRVATASDRCPCMIAIILFTRGKRTPLPKIFITH